MDMISKINKWYNRQNGFKKFLILTAYLVSMIAFIKCSVLTLVIFGWFMLLGITIIAGARAI